MTPKNRTPRIRWLKTYAVTAERGVKAIKDIKTMFKATKIEAIPIVLYSCLIMKILLFYFNKEAGVEHMMEDILPLNLGMA